MTQGADTLDIGSRGLIGGMCSVALVATNRAVDWCRLPGFDSASVFVSLLDGKMEGRLQNAPPDVSVRRREYLSDTNILQISYSTATDTLTVADFMVVRVGMLFLKTFSHEGHRVVTCNSGEVDVLRVRAETGLGAKCHGTDGSWYGRGTPLVPDCSARADQPLALVPAADEACWRVHDEP